MTEESIWSRWRYIGSTVRNSENNKSIKTARTRSFDGTTLPSAPSPHPNVLDICICFTWNVQQESIVFRGRWPDRHVPLEHSSQPALRASLVCTPSPNSHTFTPNGDFYSLSLRLLSVGIAFNVLEGRSLTACLLSSYILILLNSLCV
jgi:hypothetical protein